jgi:hypothetical protein
MLPKRAIAAIFISVAIILLVYFSVSAGFQSGNTIKVIGNETPPANSGNSAIPAGSIKFSDTPYYPYAYQISGNSRSNMANQALAGFKLDKTDNSDGTTTYILTALKQEYVNQSYTLQPGQSLYFIEMSMGDDDTANNADYNLGDDFAVVVDSNGYIVQ